MKVFAPEMQFRGTRSYVHSTDLYEQLLAGAVETGIGEVDGSVTLKIRRRITAQPEFCFLTADESMESGAADFVVEVGDGRVRGFVRETDRPVDGRRPYDEAGTWNKAEFSANAVTAHAGESAAPIETITALAVQFHKEVVGNAALTRWMLSRIEFHRPPEREDLLPLQITLRQQVAGRMTRSQVTGTRGVLGTLEFILAPA